MPIVRFFLPLLTTSVLLNCSADTVNRAAYESVQNLRQQECQKTQISGCNARQNYDAYQQELKNSP